MNIPQSDVPRVVVIGCVFAGIQFVKKINTKHYQVGLIDKNNYFIKNYNLGPLAQWIERTATDGEVESSSLSWPTKNLNFCLNLVQIYFYIQCL